MAGNATQHVSGIELRVDDDLLDPQFADRIIEVTVRNSLMLPDLLVVRTADPRAGEVEGNPMKIGADIDVLAGARTDKGTYKTIFKGQIAAIEPTYGRRECIVGIRAYDKALKLYQDVKSRTFQNQTATDIVEKILSEYDLSIGEMESSGTPYDFIQQNGQTDADFIWGLARRHDFEFIVNGNKAHFRSAGKGDSAPVTLRWQEKLRSFRPRVSGIQQPDEVIVRHQNPETAELIEASASASSLSSTPGISRSEVASSVGGGTVVVSDRVVFSNSEAQALARSTMRQLAESYIEAEGIAEGNPGILAGTKINIENVGTKFSGKYTVTETTHTYKSGREYEKKI